MPVMAYIADKFNCFYNGGFWVGQFWFIFYLLIISIVSVGIFTLIRKVNFKPQKEIYKGD